jgi:hypothetical protein
MIYPQLSSDSSGVSLSSTARTEVSDVSARKAARFTSRRMVEKACGDSDLGGAVLHGDCHPRYGGSM